MRKILVNAMLLLASILPLRAQSADQVRACQSVYTSASAQVMQAYFNIDRGTDKSAVSRLADMLENPATLLANDPARSYATFCNAAELARVQAVLERMTAAGFLLTDEQARREAEAQRDVAAKNMAASVDYALVQAAKAVDQAKAAAK